MRRVLNRPAVLAPQCERSDRHESPFCDRVLLRSRSRSSQTGVDSRCANLSPARHAARVSPKSLLTRRLSQHASGYRNTVFTVHGRRRPGRVAFAVGVRIDESPLAPRTPSPTTGPRRDGRRESRASRQHGGTRCRSRRALAGRRRRTDPGFDGVVRTPARRPSRDASPRTARTSVPRIAAGSPDQRDATDR